MLQESDSSRSTSSSYLFFFSTPKYMLVKNTDKKFARANIFFLIVAVIAREIITILDKNINLFDTLTS